MGGDRGGDRELAGRLQRHQSHNNFVRGLLRILYTLTEPVFRQVRKVIPPVGGLDLSPIVVFVVIWFLQYTIQYLSFRGTI